MSVLMYISQGPTPREKQPLIPKISSRQGKFVSDLEDSLASVAATLQTLPILSNPENSLSPKMGSLRKRFLSLTPQMDDRNREDENICHAHRSGQHPVTKSPVKTVVRESWSSSHQLSSISVDQMKVVHCTRNDKP